MAAGTKRFRRQGLTALALILIVCFFPQPAAAQGAEGEWNRLNQAVVTAYRTGQYAEGERIAGV